MPGLSSAILVFCMVSSRLHTCSAQQAGKMKGLSEFFSQLDTDQDGQIQPAEAIQYIGKEFGETDFPEQDLGAAVQRMESKLDSSDTDVTVSQAEVEAHLRNLLQANLSACVPA